LSLVLSSIPAYGRANELAPCKLRSRSVGSIVALRRSISSLPQLRSRLVPSCGTATNTSS
jgi:hypothetical protein